MDFILLFHCSIFINIFEIKYNVTAIIFPESPVFMLKPMFFIMEVCFTKSKQPSSPVFLFQAIGSTTTASCI